MYFMDIVEDERRQAADKAHEIGIEEGKSIGLEEGKSIGIEEGKSIGLEEGKSIGINIGEINKARQTAVSLLNMGLLTHEQIAQCTGLEVDEIRKLALATDI